MARDNPVSRNMVESIWNQFGEYFPVMHSSGGNMGGFGVGVKLPEAHKKWIAHINGNPRFREIVRQEIESIFSRHVFNGRTYLKISWSPSGTVFETDGVNGCMVYVDPSSASGCSYVCHNIDSFEQATVLFLALSMYLPRLYFALENLESGEFKAEDFPPLEERIDETIALNRIQGCQMKSGECLHWKSWLCEYCTRNPKAYYLETQEDLSRIGDKWEPEGGLPGKELCDVCGANKSTDRCPFCDQ